MHTEDTYWPREHTLHCVHAMALAVVEKLVPALQAPHAVLLDGVQLNETNDPAAQTAQDCGGDAPPMQ